MPKKYSVIVSEEHLYKMYFAVEAESKEEAEQKALAHDGIRYDPDEFKGVSHRQVEEVIIHE